jgi:hypothetical protein
MDKKRVLFLCLLFAGATRLTGRALAQEPGAPPILISTAAAPTETEYVYKGDRLRDPFIPLVGSGGAAVSAVVQAELGAFNPAGAELKGILKSPTGRWAILRTTDGGVYIVQNGKVHDPKRRVVDGYQGVIKERTLILLGPKNEEVELRLKKDEEAANNKP